MAKFLSLLIILLLVQGASAAPKVDFQGAWYGTNYTLPFAHAYRAVGTNYGVTGLDMSKLKETIDKDVYHISRLGLNAVRIHLWDVEITDSQGNLLDNEHLELLDYLIAALDKKGISMMITAQTNFGNGYPERDTDPNNAYSYIYDKCSIHANKKAQEAQRNYLTALAAHVNKYSKKRYNEDPTIVAIEINNEPCHTGSDSDITSYINSMTNTLRKAGWKKPVLYNASHNFDHTQAIYNADIDGVTFQWYPLGLVSGQTRHGNFLPYIDSYDIPFARIKGFEETPKIVYEFDPADNLAGYLFPAMARTFRKEGFSWITQFAYDPLEIANRNTEYQTHYLNLAYTPSKAVAMAIAAEVVKNIPEGADFGKYPVDTVFGPFTVSARRNMAVANLPDRFLYSNSTEIYPLAGDDLKKVIGVGSSAVVDYKGTGAYFLDRFDDNTWRLELMPDVEYITDPFAKPTGQPVAQLIDNPRSISINLPGLSENFNITYLPRNPRDKVKHGRAQGTTFTATPGVMLLSPRPRPDTAHPANVTFGDKKWLIGEYAVPKYDPNITYNNIRHTAPAIAYKGDSITLSTFVSFNSEGFPAPEKVEIYPSDVSFWRKDNKTFTLDPVGGRNYSATIAMPENADEFSYNIVVTDSLTYGSQLTYPGGKSGAPLDWNFETSDYYTIPLINPDDQVTLFTPARDGNGTALTPIPANWEGISYRFTPAKPKASASMDITAGKDSPAKLLLTSKYIAPVMSALTRHSTPESFMVMELGDVSGADSLVFEVVTVHGFTYGITLNANEVSNKILKVPFHKLTLMPTILTSEPYPTFLKREFVPDPATAIPVELQEIEEVRAGVKRTPGNETKMQIRGIWLDTVENSLLNPGVYNSIRI